MEMTPLFSFPVSGTIIDYRYEDDSPVPSGVLSSLREYEYEDYGIETHRIPYEGIITMYARAGKLYTTNSSGMYIDDSGFSFYIKGRENIETQLAIGVLVEQNQDDIIIESKNLDLDISFNQVKFSISGNLKAIFENCINLLYYTNDFKTYFDFFAKQFANKKAEKLLREQEAKELLNKKAANKQKNISFVKDNESFKQYEIRRHEFHSKFGHTNPKNHKLKSLFFYGICIKKDISIKEFRSVFTVYTSDVQALNELKNSTSSLEKNFPNLDIAQIDILYKEMKILFDYLMLYFYQNEDKAPFLKSIINTR